MAHDKARIWFFSDIHGSNECFRKFLRAVENQNRPNVLIIGGDITGKQIIPLLKDEHGVIHTTIGRKPLRFPASTLTTLKEQLSDVGYYTYECDEKEYNQFKFDKETHRKVFDGLVRDRLREWVKMADEKLPSPDDCQVFVNAGNDDPFFVDEILDTSAKLRRPEGKVFELPCGLKLLSTGYSGVTPWNCPRDVEEDELKRRIAEMTVQLSAKDLRRAIFNFHCPPKNTALDLANKIDRTTLQKIPGFKGSAKEHVGSQAVREAIETWQPLAGLHGHIHEVSAKDQIGQTMCYNPGTDYYTGHLQGVFLQVNSSGKVEIDLLTHERDPRNAKPKAKSLIEGLIAQIPLIGPIFQEAQAHARDEHLIQQIVQLKEEVNSLKKERNDSEPSRSPPVT